MRKHCHYHQNHDGNGTGLGLPTSGSLVEPDVLSKGDGAQQGQSSQSQVTPLRAPNTKLKTPLG